MKMPPPQIENMGGSPIFPQFGMQPMTGPGLQSMPSGGFQYPPQAPGGGSGMHRGPGRWSKQGMLPPWMQQQGPMSMTPFPPGWHENQMGGPRPGRGFRREGFAGRGPMERGAGGMGGPMGAPMGGGGMPPPMPSPWGQPWGGPVGLPSGGFQAPPPSGPIGMPSGGFQYPPPMMQPFPSSGMGYGGGY